MQNIIFLTLTLYVINAELLNPSYQFHNTTKSIRPNASIEKALITGDKRYIAAKTKKSLKNLALLHLFTPSGLHYSSILSIFFFSKKVRSIFILISFLLMGFLGPLYALKRVIVFYLLQLIIKNTRLSFILTFLISLLSTNYSDNPLSYLFSFIFWSSIIFNKFRSIRFYIFLFIIQCSLAMVMHTTINALTLIVNPILTLLITLFFPLLCLCYLLNLFSPIRSFIYTNLEILINKLNISELSFIPTFSLLLILLLLTYRRNRLFIISLIFLSFNHTTNIRLFNNYRSFIYPLRPKSEIINRSKKGIYFIDRRCQKKEVLFLCKKKPSRFGGPTI